MYHIYKTDFNKPGSRATRGTVFALDPYGVFNGEVVCVPFYKFFNAGEKHAYRGTDDDIISIQNKLDGSLIKLFYWDNKWCVATNGTAIAEDKYKKIFENAVQTTVDELGANLNKDNVYIFELYGPDNLIVVPYHKNSATLLMTREILTWDEIPNIPMLPYFDVVNEVEFDPNAKLIEGVVVVYSNGNRVKKKTAWYINNHKNRAKKWTTSELRKAVHTGYIDDVYDVLSTEQKLYVNDFRLKYIMYITLIELRLSMMGLTLEEIDIKDKLYTYLKSGLFYEVFPNYSQSILNVLSGKHKRLELSNKILLSI
jgi:hypothetical protein